MSSLVLIPPKTVKPRKLGTLASRMIGQEPGAGAQLRKFPLLHMEEIFAAFADGREKEVSIIDHCRLTMALIVNLHTILEGKKERYSNLCNQYLPNKTFVQAVFRKSVNDVVSHIYLQKIFLRFETVKKPHLEFMEEFHLQALEAENVPEKLDVLVKIKENKTAFLKDLAKHSLKAGRSVQRIWDGYDMIEDEYVQKEYLIHAENYLVNELINNGAQIDLKVFNKFLLQLVDFSQKSEVFVPRLEKFIFAAENIASFQQPLIEFVEKNIKIPPNWDLTPGISKEAITTYERLCGLVEFQYFERIAEVIYEMFLNDQDEEEKRERERLQSRTFFWMNYRDQIDHIKVFMYQDNYKKTLGNFAAYKSKFNISERLLGNVGTTSINAELVLVLIGGFLVVECFRGASKKALLIPNGSDIFESIKDQKKLHLDDLEYFESRAEFSVNHIMLWQKALMNFLADRFRIMPRGNQILHPIKGNNFFEHYQKKRTAYMSKTEKIIFEHFSDHHDLVSKVIEPKSTRVNSNIIVRRRI